MLLDVQCEVPPHDREADHSKLRLAIRTPSLRETAFFTLCASRRNPPSTSLPG